MNPNKKDDSFIYLLKRLINKLQKKRKIQFFFLLIIMLLNTFAEVVSIGLVIPFIGFLTQSEKLWNNPFVRQFATTFGYEEPSQLLLLTTILFSLTCIFAAMVRLLSLFLNLRFSAALGSDIGAKVYQNCLYQPYTFYISRNSSELLTNFVNDIGKVANELFNPLLQTISASLICIALIITLMFINAKIAFSTLFIVTVFYLFAVLITKNKIRQLSYDLDFSLKQLIKIVQEGIGGIKDILLNSSQRFYVNTFASSDVPFRRSQSNVTFFTAIPRLLIEPIGISVMAFFGFYLVNTGKSSEALPLLGAIALGAQRLLPMAQKIYEGVASSRGTIIQLRNVVNLLEIGNNIFKNELVYEKLNFRDKIVFDNVCFRYSQEGEYILKNINLTINKGEKIGIVGTTGGGKSTFLDLLTGLLEPTQGRILIDGKNIFDKNNTNLLYKWRSIISYVPQFIYLSDDTIINNIAFAAEPNTIKKKKVSNSSKKAQIKEFIESLPMTYDTRVGERGVKLSGGQKQRIGIARALYKNSKVIVFDEATSALDSNTESSLIEAVNNLQKELTIVMVAHRISTLKSCDRIIRLENGELINN